MRTKVILWGAIVLAACNGSVAGDDAGDSGGPNDATTNDGTATDASPPQDAAKDSSGSQCIYSIAQVNDAGACHTSEGDINCGAEDPNFDRCVGAELHAADGGAFGATECFDSDADNGSIVCCNGTNPSGVTLLFASTWTCCAGAAPDGGTAACDPDTGQACVETDGGWTCQ